MLTRPWAVLGLLASLTGVSPLAAQAPAGATAKCKDDTYSTSATHRGACRGHGGVAEWLAETKEGKGKGPASTTAPTTPTAAMTAEPPADATAKCKDGSYWTNASHRGACKGHKGVSEWLANDKGAGKAATKNSGFSSETAPAQVSATVVCKDGTTSKRGKGACSHHGGVGEAAAPAAAPANPPAAIPNNPPLPVTAKEKAATPGTAADATAQCNDGSYSHAQHHRGACSKHGGVKQWLKDVPK